MNIEALLQALRRKSDQMAADRLGYEGETALVMPWSMAGGSAGVPATPVRSPTPAPLAPTNDPRGSLQPTPRNPFMGAVADALRGTTELLNSPGKIAGIGLGDITTGQSGEVLDDLSYGGSASRGKGWSRKLNPEWIDLAMLPGIGTAVNALRKGTGKVMGRAVAEEASDPGRRNAMKGVGAAAAGAAGVDLIPKIAPRAESTAIRAMEQTLGKEALDAMSKHGPTQLDPSVYKAMTEIFTPAELGRLKANPKNLSWLSQAQREELSMFPISFKAPI